MQQTENDWRKMLPEKVALHVTPRASRARVLPEYAGDGTVERLRVYVTVPPEDGKANDAVVALLAKELGLPKSAVRIVQGSTGRNKVVLLVR